jgi:hypothetical protein
MLGVLALGACAGRSARQDLDSGSGAGRGGAGSGGNPGAGLGGQSTAAAGSGGMFVLGNAAGKTSEGLPTCLLPPDPGPCRGAQPRFAFDPTTVACVPFTYGGCEGNDNRFETLEACRSACIDVLPAGCDAAQRPDGCPCTEMEQCEGGCESGAFPSSRMCAPVTAGYCRSCCSEGEHACWITGDYVSGV